MNILLSTDNSYVMPTGILMYSLCKNNSSHIDFYILTDSDLSEDNKYKLKENVLCFDANVFFVFVPDIIRDVVPIDREGQPEYISIATYYRLFIQDLIPHDIDKILYLDGDIICRHSLEGLWNTDVDYRPAAAVYEIENNDGRYKRLEYPESDGYFNAGVLLINLKYWREHNIQSLFLNYLREYSDRVVYHDQDVINAIFHGKILPLPLKYNALNSYFVKNDYKYLYPENEVSAARQDPILVHYSSHLKPWYKGCSHPYAKEFLYYKTFTPWAKKSLRTFPSRTLIGKLSNFFVSLGIKKYKGNYIKL